MKKSELKQLILEAISEKEETSEEMITPYQAWINDVSFASSINNFKKHLFQAYNKANAKNSKKLEKAFPELFVTQSITKK